MKNTFKIIDAGGNNLYNRNPGGKVGIGCFQHAGQRSKPWLSGANKIRAAQPVVRMGPAEIKADGIKQEYGKSIRALDSNDCNSCQPSQNALNALSKGQGHWEAGNCAPDASGHCVAKALDPLHPNKTKGHYVACDCNGFFVTSDFQGGINSEFSYWIQNAVDAVAPGGLTSEARTLYAKNAASANSTNYQESINNLYQAAAQLGTNQKGVWGPGTVSSSVDPLLESEVLAFSSLKQGGTVEKNINQSKLYMLTYWLQQIDGGSLNNPPASIFTSYNPMVYNLAPPYSPTTFSAWLKANPGYTDYVLGIHCGQIKFEWSMLVENDIKTATSLAETFVEMMSGQADTNTDTYVNNYIAASGCPVGLYPPPNTSCSNIINNNASGSVLGAMTLCYPLIHSAYVNASLSNPKKFPNTASKAPPTNGLLPPAAGSNQPNAPGWPDQWSPKFNPMGEAGAQTPSKEVEGILAHKQHISKCLGVTCTDPKKPNCDPQTGQCVAKGGGGNDFEDALLFIGALGLVGAGVYLYLNYSS